MRRTASPNTAVPASVIAGSCGSSIGRAKPTGSSVSGESYPVESTDSVIVIESTRSQTPAETIPSRFANPGFIPVPKIELCPRSHASTSCRRSSARSASPVMNAAVVTTLAPDSRICTRSLMFGHFGL